MPTNTNREIAIRLRERYEFYLVALTFTIAGLSIQTARLGFYPLSDAAEIAGWTALLMTGVIGLYRLATAHFIYDVFGEIWTFEKELRQFQELQQQGVAAVPLEGGGTKTPAELIKDRETVIAKAEAQVSKINKIQARTLPFQCVLFLIGIGLLTFSRGYEPLLAATEGSRVYTCNDARTKLPAFFKISASGFVEVSLYSTDGETYSFLGQDSDYSRFFRSEKIYYQDVSGKYRISLDLDTGAYYIADRDLTSISSGICKLASRLSRTDDAAGGR